MSKNLPKNTLSKGYKMATCRPSHSAGRFQDIHDIGGGKDHNRIHFRNLAAANQGSISRHEVSSCEHRYPDLTPYIAVYSNMWYININTDHVNMFEVWKFNIKKNRSPTTFAGLIWGPWRHPVAREQLWSGRRATRWHRGAALVVVWFVHAANSSGRGGDGGGLIVGEEFLLGSWGLETNHACNNIFSRFPW